jgi:hypothetical protein
MIAFTKDLCANTALAPIVAIYVKYAKKKKATTKKKPNTTTRESYANTLLKMDGRLSKTIASNVDSNPTNAFATPAIAV